MSFLGNIVRSVVNPATIAQLAMGPAGWASLAVRTIASAVGKELIQAIGQRLGLPQGIIDLGKDAFGAATGTQGGPSTVAGAISSLAGGLNLSPASAGRLDREASDLSRSMADFINQQSLSDLKESLGGKGSWVRAFVKAFGPKLDKLANEMTKLAGEAQKTPSKATEFQAASQEFNLLMTTVSSAIKAVGEAQAQMARKQ